MDIKHIFLYAAMKANGNKRYCVGSCEYKSVHEKGNPTISWLFLKVKVYMMMGYYNTTVIINAKLIHTTQFCLTSPWISSEGNLHTNNLPSQWPSGQSLSPAGSGFRYLFSISPASWLSIHLAFCLFQF